MFTSNLSSKLGFVATITALLISCKPKIPFVLETHEVDFRNITSGIVHGNPLDLDVAGCCGLTIYDSLLMVISGDAKSHLQVYDIQTLIPMAMLCPQGHARNEFADNVVFMDAQTFTRNGDVIVIMRGEGGSVLKEINVSASIKEGATVVEGINNKITFNHHDVVGLDNGVERLFGFNNRNYSYERKTYNVPTFEILEKSGITDIEVYRDLVEFEDMRCSEFWYDGFMCKHPTRNVVVQCMQSMDYIHFFNIDANECYSVHQLGSPVFDDLRVPKDMTEDGYLLYDFNHFRAVTGTADFFIVNGYIDLSKDNPDTSELHVFDWEGNYLGGVKIDNFFDKIAYDSKKCVLYGLKVRSEKIFTYDLSAFMKTHGI